MHGSTRIVYGGCGMSGRRTSLASVLKHGGSNIDWPLIEGTKAYDTLFHHQSRRYALSMTVLARHAKYLDLPADDEERVILARAHGMVFVVDSQPERMEGNLHQYEQLRHVPHVIQINKCDLPGRCSITTIRAILGTDAPCVESVAIRGIGTVEAVCRLLDVMPRRS